MSKAEAPAPENFTFLHGRWEVNKKRLPADWAECFARPDGQAVIGQGVAGLSRAQHTPGVSCSAGCWGCTTRRSPQELAVWWSRVGPLVHRWVGHARPRAIPSLVGVTPRQGHHPVDLGLESMSRNQPTVGEGMCVGTS